jgi:hypothetical protein
MYWFLVNIIREKSMNVPLTRAFDVARQVANLQEKNKNE